MTDNANNVTMFTTREGKQVKVESWTIPASEMVSILRIKEDFEARGEHLSTFGVVSHLLSQGITSTRNYWKSAEANKNRRDFAKGAALCFNSDGSIKDPQGLAALASKYGLVKGTPREV